MEDWLVWTALLVHSRGIITIQRAISPLNSGLPIHNSLLVKHLHYTLKADLLIRVVFNQLVELRLEDDHVDLEVRVLGNLDTLLDESVDATPLVVGHESLVTYALWVHLVVHLCAFDLILTKVSIYFCNY